VPCNTFYSKPALLNNANFSFENLLHGQLRPRTADMITGAGMNKRYDGERQGWSSGESGHLPPVCPGFASGPVPYVAA